MTRPCLRSCFIPCEITSNQLPLTGVLIKSLARPTSRCIFFMVRIFPLMLVLLYIYIYIYSTNIPPIMIINRIYEGWNFNSGNYLFTIDTK